ncbi:MAG TPA: SDR family oxidoreductase [Steroidobacteraceae bacterium]|nr:SDR family oxidoreductase [Steroidobacteraceae bacterium]
MQKVLITGAANGIGRETARAFSRNGAQVAGLDLDAAALTVLAMELPGFRGERCDLGDAADIGAAVPRALDALGGLDVLINNVGIAGPTARIEDYDPAAWEQVLRVNLGAAFHVTKLCIPALKRAGGGSIVNLSSAAGRFGYPQRCAYSVSKWGLIGFTRTLSMELGEFGIRANALLPGPVAGERMERVLAGRVASNGSTLEQERTNALRNQSLKYFTEAGEVAALAVFLASDAARSISGQSLPIDGDMHRSV